MRQAFRLGILVDDISQNLQPRDLTDTGTLDTWAYVLPDTVADEVQQELNAIYAKEVSLIRPRCHKFHLMTSPESAGSQ